MALGVEDDDGDVDASDHAHSLITEQMSHRRFDVLEPDLYTKFPPDPVLVLYLVY